MQQKALQQNFVQHGFNSPSQVFSSLGFSISVNQDFLNFQRELVKAVLMISGKILRRSLFCAAVFVVSFLFLRADFSNEFSYSKPAVLSPIEQIALELEKTG